MSKEKVDNRIQQIMNLGKIAEHRLKKYNDNYKKNRKQGLETLKYLKRLNINI